jgi:hypothetical protein
MVVKERRQGRWHRWQTRSRALLASATLSASSCAPGRPPAAPEPLSAASSRPTDAGPPKRNALDEHALEAMLDKRVDEVTARPTIDRAFEQLLEGVFNDNALGEQAESLMSELGDASEIAPHVAAIEDAIGQAPGMSALVARLMSQNPNATPEQLGALAEAHVSRQIDSPAVDQALDRVIERFFEQPALNAAFDELGTAISENPHVLRSLSQSLRSLEEDKLQQRLTQLNGGSMPGPARTMELLATHAFSADRIERLMLDWVELSETREELRRLVRELLREPAFRRHVLRLFSDLLSDRAFQNGLQSSFALLLEANPDPDAMARELSRALDTQRTTTSCTNFVTALTRDPELQVIGDRCLARLTASPGFIGSFERFASGW